MAGRSDTFIPHADKSLLDEALDIARCAGDLTLEWFKPSGVAFETKTDGSPVTDADKAAEEFVRLRIEKITPHATIIGEEHGTTQRSSSVAWYVDPIDGTYGFSRGVPLYATLIGVSDEHGPAVGVIHLPATNETVWAGRGLGAFTNDGLARVSERKTLKGSCVTTSCVSRWPTDVIARMQAAGVDVRGWGDGYGFMMVAAGRLEAMVDIGVGNPWDFAPMPVIMLESGGRFSCLDGGESFDTRDGIATNGILHEELLALIRGVDPAP